MRFEIQICNKATKPKPHSNKWYCYITKICLFFFFRWLQREKMLLSFFLLLWRMLPVKILRYSSNLLNILLWKICVWKFYLIVLDFNIMHKISNIIKWNFLGVFFNNDIMLIISCINKGNLLVDLEEEIIALYI